MKKTYLSLLTILSTFSLSAQLTQANHAFSSGDTYQTYQCDSTGISPGAGGAGANWNFSAVATHSNILSSFTAAASSNTAFPVATVSVSSSAADPAFYNSTSTALNYYGGNITVSPVAASLMYTAPAVYAVYPMNLNTSTATAIGGNINVTSPAAATGTFAGNCIVAADGTGTLTIPGGTTFSNVTRVVTSQTINFTALVTGTVTQLSYEYFQPGIKGPLFSIKMATVATAFSAPSQQTIVTRAKISSTPNPTTSVIGVEASNVSELSVYPNPSLSHVNFVSKQGTSGQVFIYDITGKLVEKRSLNDGKLRLDVSSYHMGLYVYTLISDEGKQLKTGKITVGE